MLSCYYRPLCFIGGDIHVDHRRHQFKLIHLCFICYHMKHTLRGTGVRFSSIVTLSPYVLPGNDLLSLSWSLTIATAPTFITHHSLALLNLSLLLELLVDFFQHRCREFRYRDAQSEFMWWVCWRRISLASTPKHDIKKDDSWNRWRF